MANGNAVPEIGSDKVASCRCFAAIWVKKNCLWDMTDMMIDVTVANVDLDLITSYTHMNPLTAGADLLWHSKDRLVFQAVSGDRFVVTGTDLHWGTTGLTAARSMR